MPTQDDGWTSVPVRGKRTKPSPTLPIGLNPPSRGMTLAKIQTDFDAKMKAWQQSQCRKSTIQLLRRIRPDGGWQLRKALCLASGSFSRENVECRRRSLWQLAVFVDLVEYLREDGEVDGGGDVEVFAQEPEYTESDGEFLRTLGIKVLEVTRESGNGGLGPAKEFLGRETVVYEPFMDMNVQMLGEIGEADVGLYIGSSIRGLIAKEGEVGRLAKLFGASRSMYRLPRFEVDPNVLDGIGIYWKEERDADEA